MSNGNVHLAVGAISGIAAIPVSSQILPLLNTGNVSSATYMMCIPVAALYSLLPDIDIKSKGSKLFFLLILGICGYLVMQGNYKIACLVFALSLIPQLFAHRKFTHSIFFAVIFPMPVYYIFKHFQIGDQFFLLFYISALFGYVSHLIMDNF